MSSKVQNTGQALFREKKFPFKKTKTKKIQKKTECSFGRAPKHTGIVDKTTNESLPAYAGNSNYRNTPIQVLIEMK